MALKPGIRLGPYEIVSSLGVGGMGEVYRARDGRLGRDVAVKVLPQHLGRDTEALGRFEREAQTLAALSHPGILTLFDFGNEAGILYAVMELLEGETLSSRMKQGPLAVEKVLEIGIAVADGLAAAHSRGIIHRDLKPENIFITSDERVKILDFGLVRWNRAPQNGPITELPTGPLDTKSGLVMGTVHYMSPEQVRGQTVDERTHLFSLGIVLYEMLHGVRPFAEETMAETMVAILKQDPAHSSDRRLISPDLDRIIRSCLQKDPSKRIPGAKELLAGLREVAGGATLTITLPKSGARRATRRKKVIDSVAILPFTNVAVDPEVEYLADGITETIINLLSQIPKLRVMARSTVFLYKGKAVDPRTVGQELNVRAILTGRLLLRNENLNVQVELVDTEDGSQLWGEQYNQQICDIQIVQQDIAREISDRLKLRLVGEDRRRLQKRYTESVAAYRLYLQGRFHWNRRTEEDLQKGIELFNQAIVEDPGFALAYAGLSDSYSVLAGFYLMPPSDAYPKARDAALRALQMDPSMGEAYCSLATVKERYDWDWEGAGLDFRRALKLSPGYATAHHWYATFLVMMGKFKDAEKAMAKALELDPLAVAMHWSTGYVHYYSRNYGKAIEYYKAALNLDPQFYRARFDMGLAMFLNGQTQEGLHVLEEWLSEAPDTFGMLPLRGYYYAISGRSDLAQEMIRRVEDLPGEKYISRFSLAVIHVALGDKETAFACLQKSLENHEDAMVSFNVNPRLDSIRSDPRFTEILRATGLA